MAALATLVLAILTGCATSYELNKTADGACTISVDSSRDVGGATVAVDGTSCSLTADVGQMDAMQEELLLEMARELNEARSWR